MAVNLQALQNQNSPYVRVAEPRNIGGRVIHKYVCNHNGDQARIAAAVDVINGLRANNPNLRPTFQAQGQQLAATVQQEIYLTINGLALSLAREREAAGDANAYRDRYFSETLIEEPARCQCPERHLFERRRALFWAAREPRICPVGNHPIGDLEVVAELHEDINRYRGHRAEQQRMQQAAIDQNNIGRLNNNLMDLQNRAVRHVQEVNIKTIAGGAGKLLIKSSEGVVVKIATKHLSKEAVKTTGKIAKIAIPGLSLVVGIGFCFYRLSEGQFVRALGEIASGAAACVPGVGTAISISLDATMVAYDAYEALKAAPARVVAEPDLNEAYQNLGIDLEEDPNPPRELVQRQYNLHAGVLHPDRAAQLGDYNQQRLDEIMAVLNRSRDLIFQRRQWA